MSRTTYEESQRIPFGVIFILWGEVLDFHGYLGILYNKWSGSLNVDIEPHMRDGMMKLGRCLPEYMSKVVMMSVLYSLQMRLMKFKMAAKNAKFHIRDLGVTLNRGNTSDRCFQLKKASRITKFQNHQPCQNVSRSNVCSTLWIVRGTNKTSMKYSYPPPGNGNGKK